MLRYSGLLLIAVCIAGCAELPKIETMQLPLDTQTGSVDASGFVIQTPDVRLPERELLTFEVRWLGMRVGTLTTAVKGIENYKGRDVYVLEATMKSNSFLSKIYKLEDRFVSYMDVEKLHTLRHEVYRRDGNYKKDAITEFDQVNHKAHFKNLLDKSEKDFDIPENVQDILTACYYFMLLPLSPGQSVEYQVCNNERNYKFFAFVESKALIKISALGKQKKEAFLIQPYATHKGEKVDKGRVSAYFSCDKRRLPLVATVRAPVFTEVAISLLKIENK